MAGQEEAPLVILALDACCIYTDVLFSRMGVVLNIIRHLINKLAAPLQLHLNGSIKSIVL